MSDRSASARFDRVITAARLEGVSGLSDIGIRGGLIAAIEPARTVDVRAPGVDVQVVEADGRVVRPAFVETHLHLDKALLGASEAGSTLPEAIAATALAKAAFTEEDLLDRARRVVRSAMAAGTTTIRAHTEVDPGVGLMAIRAMTRLADQLHGVLRMQIAVFPQEGLTSRPGTLTLMREALTLLAPIGSGRLPAVVGGCPYSEVSAEDARAHVRTVLDLAEEFGLSADLHLDFADDGSDARFMLADYVAQATIERGLQGRVSIGHATSLGALAPDIRTPILDALAKAAVTVVVLPATDLYLMGRHDVYNIRRGLAPLTALWSAGVPTALSSNNVRNAFTPSGRADLLDIAQLLLRVAHLSSPEDSRRVLEMASTNGARVVEPGIVHGLEVGARADLIVLDTVDPSSVIFDQPARSVVLAAGIPIYTESRQRTWLGLTSPSPER